MKYRVYDMDRNGEWELCYENSLIEKVEYFINKKEKAPEYSHKLPNEIKKYLMVDKVE